MNIEVTSPNSVHILWLIPQYFVVTIGEVMFSVTGLTFSFTQVRMNEIEKKVQLFQYLNTFFLLKAPPSMRSIMQAMWTLIVAFGNVIVIIVAEVKGIKRQVKISIILLFIILHI